jgi:hypothetical protein
VADRLVEAPLREGGVVAWQARLIGERAVLRLRRARDVVGGLLRRDALHARRDASAPHARPDDTGRRLPWTPTRDDARCNNAQQHCKSTSSLAERRATSNQGITKNWRLRTTGQRSSEYLLASVEHGAVSIGSGGGASCAPVPAGICSDCCRRLESWPLATRRASFAGTASSTARASALRGSGWKSCKGVAVWGVVVVGSLLGAAEALERGAVAWPVGTGAVEPPRECTWT